MNTAKNISDHNRLDPSFDSFRDALNRPLRDLRISVTDQCNLRCTSCQPFKNEREDHALIENKEWLNPAEIIRFAKLMIQLGVLKIRLTGGEPLLRKDLLSIIQGIRAISPKTDLALTTNATLLSQYAPGLKKAGLDRVTIRLDTLDENLFSFLNGDRANVRQILEGIDAATKAGFSSIKINAVIQKGLNDRTVLDLIKFFRGTPHIVRFIEYMDVGNQNDWTYDKVVPNENLYTWINEQFPLTPIAPNYKGEVARRYRYVDKKGEIGFISAVSDPFCDTCHRLRLSADGKLYLCLFANGGINIKSFLREGLPDSKILDRIQTIWRKRCDQYSKDRDSWSQKEIKIKKVEMYKIGG